MLFGAPLNCPQGILPLPPFSTPLSTCVYDNQVGVCDKIYVIKTAYVDKVLSRACVCDWHKFKNGRISLKDKFCSERQSVSNRKANINK